MKNVKNYFLIAISLLFVNASFGSQLSIITDLEELPMEQNSVTSAESISNPSSYRSHVSLAIIPHAVVDRIREISMLSNEAWFKTMSILLFLILVSAIRALTFQLQNKESELQELRHILFRTKTKLV